MKKNKYFYLENSKTGKKKRILSKNLDKIKTEVPLIHDFSGCDCDYGTLNCPHLKKRKQNGNN